MNLPLYIATDLGNKNWLTYILEEFKRINVFKSDIRLISVNEASSVDSNNVIFYTKACNNKLSLIDKSEILPNGQTTYISDNIFVLSNSITNDNGFLRNYDLLWNSFVFLSRLEEFSAENTGKRIGSYSTHHPRVDKSTFNIPIINNLFNEFEEIIKENFSDLEFGEKQKPTVELSHDVDYIAKTLQLRLKQTAFNAFNTLKSIAQPKKFKKKVSHTFKFLFSNPTYWCFDYWKDLENSLDQKSTFYIYSRIKTTNAKSWLLDPSYNLDKNIKLQDQLKHLMEEGFEIGVHGSYCSARDEVLLQNEKENLERNIGCKITKVRQHWLNYEENSTPYIHDKIFDLDSTIGWNDRIGFRAGCLSRYRPYDHKNQKAFSFYETPLIVMDSHIFDYNSNNVDQAINSVMQMLQNLQKYKCAHVSIAWHQRVCNEDYMWQYLYKNLLEADNLLSRKKDL